MISKVFGPTPRGIFIGCQVDTWSKPSILARDETSFANGARVLAIGPMEERGHAAAHAAATHAAAHAAQANVHAAANAAAHATHAAAHAAAHTAAHAARARVNAPAVHATKCAWIPHSGAS